MRGHPSQKRIRGGGRRGAPSLGTMEDTLRISPDTDISFHRLQFPSHGNLVCEEKGSFTRVFDK